MPGNRLYDNSLVPRLFGTASTTESLKCMVAGVIKTVSGSVMMRAMIDRGMVLLGYAPHNVEHSVTSGSERRKMVHQSLVLGNKHTNVTSERGLGAPGLPRCHCIPKFRKEYVYSLMRHTLSRTKKGTVPLQLPS